MTVGASNVVSPPTPSKDATTTASAAAGSSSEVSPTPLPMPSGAKTRYWKGSRKMVECSQIKCFAIPLDNVFEST